jgi:hypothetical protein
LIYVADVFELKVSVDNLACEPIGDVIYRRNSDPDVNVGFSDDFFTIVGEDEPEFDLASNSLTCGVLPSDDCPTINNVPLPLTNSGPFDQGAVIQINLGEIEAGKRKVFRLFWGVFESEDAALRCVDGGNMNLYATATDGSKPTTYLLGFRRSIATVNAGAGQCVRWNGAPAPMPRAAAQPMTAAAAAVFKADQEEKKGRR